MTADQHAASGQGNPARSEHRFTEYDAEPLDDPDEIQTMEFEAMLIVTAICYKAHERFFTEEI